MLVLSMRSKGRQVDARMATPELHAHVSCGPILNGAKAQCNRQNRYADARSKNAAIT